MVEKNRNEEPRGKSEFYHLWYQGLWYFLLICVLGPPVFIGITGSWLFHLSIFERFLLIIGFLFAFFMGLWYFFQKYTAELSRWPVETKTDQIIIESIEIPVGGGRVLKGDLFKSLRTPKKNAKTIIVTHGLGGSRKDFYFLAISLVFRGCAVVLYDSRGHGENEWGEKWETRNIITDHSKVVDFVLTRDDLSHTDIVAVGGSMGGGVVLNEAYLDRRVKFIIALCTWADFIKTATRKVKNFPERVVKIMYLLMGINLDPSPLQNRMVSPIYNSFNRKKGFFDHPVYWDVDNVYRVMLGHCKDDMVVDYHQFEINSEFLKLPPENLLSFDAGNHAFAKMESAVLGKVFYWLDSRDF